MNTRERMLRGLVAALLVASPLALAAEPQPLPIELPQIAPRAIAWAEGRAAEVMRTGRPPDAAAMALARQVGVRHPERIRILLVERIELPDEPALRSASAKVGLARSSADGMTLGYAVVVRRAYAGDARLLSHEFRHVAQYEQAGGIAAFLAVHLRDLLQHGYEASPFEVDARAHERSSFR